MKTQSFTKNDTGRAWFVVDAEGKVLGRLATEIAKVLRGKHKPQFTPHADVGDYVVVINAEKIRVTGKKETDKKYYRHSGWVGGLKSASVGKVRASHPERIIESAVWGMIPKGPLGRQMFSKLKVYAGTEHPHEAQNPQELAL